MSGEKMSNERPIKVTLEELRREFDIKYRQLRRVLIEIYEKTKDIAPKEIKVDRAGLRYFDGEILVPLYDKEGNVYAYLPIPEYIKYVEENFVKHGWWSRRRFYEDLHAIASGIPELIEAVIEAVKKENKRLDEKLAKLELMLRVLETIEQK